MFPYNLQQALNKESDKKNNKPSNSENNNKKENKPSNWFHSYQIPAESSKPVKEPNERESKPRSKSLGELPLIPMYQPMNPEKKVDWNKFVPHPKDKDIPKYEPMNPEKKMEWNKLVPHPHLSQNKQNWFHCYQIPNEKPNES